jgi:hypothetical protein
MINGTLNDGVTEVPLYDAGTLISALARVGKPNVPGLERATSFTNQLGDEPAKAYVITLRRHLDAIDLDAIQTLSLAFTNPLTGINQARTIRCLVVSSELLCLTPFHVPRDLNVAYLLTLADCRWRISNEFFAHAC